MIPKTIHYCWFGGNTIPSQMQKYINTWKEKCPDYRIVEWNEHNFDINCCDYIKEAYEQKKWAFVSDYARFYILYRYGGIYFDTDVELLKNLDYYIEKGPFLGMENEKQIAPGLGMAAYPGMKYCKDMMDIYHNMHFHSSDASNKIKTICQYVTEYFAEKGFRAGNTTQLIDGVYIYPKEFFNPYDMETGRINVTEQTISIHHYAGTWVDPYSKFRGRIYFLIRRALGEKGARTIQSLVGRKG